MNKKFNNLRQNTIEELQKDIFINHLKLLTPLQKTRLSVLEWLIDEPGSKGTGRTHLLALAFIKIALIYPNNKIYVWDHHNFNADKKRVVRLIHHILEKDYNRLIKKFNFGSDFIIFKGV